MGSQPILDVVFGLVFIFFVFSLLCSGANELISRALDKRARFLEAAIWQLLDRGEGTDARAQWFTAFWDHPLIRQLARPVDQGWVQRVPLRAARALAKVGQGAQLKAVERLRREPRQDARAGPTFLNVPDSPTARPMYADDGRVLPSYIPASTFALVALDVLRQYPLPAAATDGNAPLDRLLRSVRQGAGVPVREARAEIEKWFDSEMDRITGWYKREIKAVLVGIATFVVILGNVDTVAMARTLWTEPAVRNLVTSTADQVIAQAVAAAQTTVPGAPASVTPTSAPRVVCATPSTTSLSATTTTIPNSLVDLVNANQCVRSLTGAGIPIGWPKPPLCLRRGQPEATARCAKWTGRVEDIAVRKWRAGLGSLLLMIGGWGLSVGALSMGAPFWWDRLNRLGSLRSTGPKPKSSTS